MKMLAIVVLLVCPGASDAVLPGPRPPLDSQGLAVLLASQPSRDKAKQFDVLVLGSAHGLGAFLGELPAETPRSLLSSTNVSSRTFCALQSTPSVALIAEDSWAQLAATVAGFEESQFPTHSPMLLWTWAEHDRGALGVLLRGVVSVPRLIVREIALAVSDRHGGGTVLFSLTTSTKLQVDVTEIDRWSPTDGRWLRRASPFTTLCSTWSGDRAPPAPSPSPQVVVAIRPHHDVAVEAYKDFVVTMANALGKSVRVEWVAGVDAVLDIVDRTRACSLPAAFSFIRAFPILAHMPPEVRYASFAIMSVQVVVPAGLDRTPFLQAVTDEFSVELWCATVVTVLAVVAATALVTRVTLGRRLASALSDALLQTLAPLLAQAAPGRTAHRPLSAVWLLMSVVLAAAYQGLLLRELTAPPGEINSLEQLEQSGLDVRVTGDLYTISKVYLPNALRARMTYVDVMGLDAVLRDVADRRNSALVIQGDMSAEILLAPYLHASPKRLHRFDLGRSYLAAHITTTTASPLQQRAARLALLVREHGLHAHMVSTIDKKQRLDVHGSRGAAEGEQLSRPLSLAQVLPAFLLLAHGYVTAALVLVVEIVYSRVCRR
ncbi:Ionotropic receptor 133 [Frankliniella occidentalis]|nr:Ionotropic receptor 133 [Frankliniella occidentalis]